MLKAVLVKNDKKARTLIYLFSFIVFAAVVLLSRVKLDVDLGFDVHFFAQANAIINSTVAVLLVAALVAVKTKKYRVHKNLMIAAMLLSVLFLISYICHHLFAGETKFGAEIVNASAENTMIMSGKEQDRRFPAWKADFLLTGNLGLGLFIMESKEGMPSILILTEQK